MLNLGGNEMKKQTIIMILVALTFLFIAPLSIVAQNLPDLEVSDLQWTHDADARFRLRSSSSARANLSSTVTTFGIQEVSALFRNTGKKTIKSVTWEYILYSDAKKTQVLHIYTSRNDTMLLPGETVRLRNTGYGLQESQYKTARITRINYTDGSVWQGTKTKR